MSLLYGAGILILLLWIAAFYRKANPAIMAKVIKRIAAVAAFGAATTLAIRGRIDLAMALGGVGLWLFGWSGLPSWASRTQPTPGAQSTVRTSMIAMTLDHATGAMRGEVLAGIFDGCDLDALELGALRQLISECTASDADGARLLEAYLDRRFPTWREDADANPYTGGSVNGGTGAMTEEEAYEILGLKPGADAKTIRKAHRALMKMLHPDQGGSTYLAARVNQAKDILIRRHR
jgi:DnaJ domain